MSVQQGCGLNLVLIESKLTNIRFILLFLLCKLIKKKININLDVVQISSHWTCGVRCVAFPKLYLWILMTAPPCDRWGSHAMGGICTSFPVIGPSLMFPPHFSSRQFEVWHRTTNNKYSCKLQSQVQVLSLPTEGSSSHDQNQCCKRQQLGF